MLDERWLAEQLKAEGLVDPRQLAGAGADGTGDLCRDLVANGVVQEAQLLRFLGLHFQTRYVSTEKLSSAKVLQWVLNLLPMEFCEEHLVLPVRCDKQRTKLSVVTTDPSDRQVVGEISRISEVHEVMAYVALPHAIEAGIRKFYRGDIHAFARMDEALRQNYSEMLDIYEQRLIDFEGDGAAPGLEDEDPPQTFRHDELVIGADEGEQQQTGSATSSTSTPARPASSDFGIVPVAQAAQARSASTILPAVSRRSGSGVMAAPASAAPPAQLRWDATDTGWVVGVLDVLVAQLERSTGWVAGHSAAVAQMAGQLAARVGLAPERIAELHIAALLHELGKPPDLHLTALNVAADAAARTYALQVYKTPGSLVASPQIPPDVLQILATVYELFRGDGVPGQLSGDRIPQAARILQVADAYWDLTANPAGGQLPAATAVHHVTEAAGAGILDPTVVRHVATIQPAATASGDRPVVLIIDEDPRSAAVLEAQIKSAGFDAVVASSTGDAALVLLGEQVCMVLSEVALKPMDGFTFLEWLRSNQRTADVPFMFVTSNADADDVNRGFELGALDYIVKPFRPEVVLAKIKRHLA